MQYCEVGVLYVVQAVEARKSETGQHLLELRGETDCQIPSMVSPLGAIGAVGKDEDKEDVFAV